MPILHFNFARFEKGSRWISWNNTVLAVHSFTIYPENTGLFTTLKSHSARFTIKVSLLPSIPFKLKNGIEIEFRKKQSPSFLRLVFFSYFFLRKRNSFIRTCAPLNSGYQERSNLSKVKEPHLRFMR